MLFNSLTFALFLPIVFALYWFVFQRNLKIQNFFIVIVSYVFYGWWDWRFLVLIAFTTLCSWSCGVLMQRVDNQHASPLRLSRKLLNISNILLNLGILGVFKYYNFFVENFVSAFASVGVHLQPHTLKIILPVGISFYTFQALSYSIDVYKRKIEPTKDIVSFFAFVSFFPQLVAGPIERATNLLPQFYVKRTFDYEKAVNGMRQILWGLFKKIVVADTCAPYVNEVFGAVAGNYGSTEIGSGITLWLAVAFFAVQVYGDFSGYSDIAIGTARLFGFNLMRNFNYPLFSRDIAEYWRRWHISQSTWFRDYVYFPLGGSRVSKLKVIRNTYILFLVSGFWHGANWTFIIWGLFNATLFLPLLLLNINRKHIDIVAKGRLLPNIKEVFQIATTFFWVTLTRVLFRAESIGHAFDYFCRMANTSLFYFNLLYKKTLALEITILIAIMLIVEWIGRENQFGLEKLGGTWKRPYRWAMYVFIIFFIFMFGGVSKTFVYFQF